MSSPGKNEHRCELHVPVLKAVLFYCRALHLCSSSMAGGEQRGRRLRIYVAVVLVLCALVRGLTCFSLQGLNKNAERDNEVNEEAVTGVRGNVLLNGEELQPQLGSYSAAITGSDEVLNTRLGHSDHTGLYSFLTFSYTCKYSRRKMNPV